MITRIFVSNKSEIFIIVWSTIYSVLSEYITRFIGIDINTLNNQWSVAYLIGSLIIWLIVLHIWQHYMGKLKLKNILVVLGVYFIAYYLPLIISWPSIEKEIEAYIQTQMARNYDLVHISYYIPEHHFLNCRYIVTTQVIALIVFYIGVVIQKFFKNSSRYSYIGSIIISIALNGIYSQSELYKKQEIKEIYNSISKYCDFLSQLKTKTTNKEIRAALNKEYWGMQDKEYTYMIETMKRPILNYIDILRGDIWKDRYEAGLKDDFTYLRSYFNMNDNHVEEKISRLEAYYNFSEKDRMEFTKEEIEQFRCEFEEYLIRDGVKTCLGIYTKNNLEHVVIDFMNRQNEEQIEKYILI